MVAILIVFFYLVVGGFAIYLAMKNIKLRNEIDKVSERYDYLKGRLSTVKDTLETTQEKFDSCRALMKNYLKSRNEYADKLEEKIIEADRLIKYGPNKLNFAIGQETFYEINSGARKYVYREAKPYWTKRLMENGELLKFDAIQFINGKEGKSLYRVDGDVHVVNSKNINSDDRVDLKENTKYYMFTLGDRIG